MNRSIPEIMFHWPAVVSRADTDFAKGFARSVARQARRPGWRPTAKQLPIMERMVSDLFTSADDEGEEISLIES